MQMNETLKNWSLHIIGVIVCVALVSLLSEICRSAFERRERELLTEVYPAWVAVNGQPGLNYQQWRALHREGLLPGLYENKSGKLIPAHQPNP